VWRGLAFNLDETLRASELRTGLNGNGTDLKGGRNGSRGGGLATGRVLFFLALLAFGTAAWCQKASISTAISSSESVLPDGPEVQAASAPAGQTPAEQVATGSIHGVVMDKDGSVYEGAKVELVWSGAQAASARTVTSDSNGQFQFSNVPTGSFQLNISSGGFGTRTVIGVLRPGESFDAKAVVLDVTSTTDVRVTASQVEIAQEQLKQEETQRVLGVIPNFYVVYDRNPAPLTPKQKFHLAWRSLVDPVTFLGVGAQAGIEQATNSFSGYGQGAKGYAKRYGAGYTDGFTGTMIGGAILASWWKQDPRYFYKGTGTIRSRALYAVAMTVMCKGDNGKWQVTYSGLVGGLAADGISNLYYPAADRSGVGLTFANFGIETGEGAIQNLIQEFVIRELTPHVPNYGVSKP
jgi:hypothetical protein